MLHMDRDRSNNCSETEPKRCWTTEVHDQDYRDTSEILYIVQPKLIVHQHHCHNKMIYHQQKH